MRVIVHLLLLAGQASSRDAALLLAQGNALYQGGELARAVAAYEACLELDPAEATGPSAGADEVFVPCVINLASVLVDLGDLPRAEELYRVALAAEPDNGDAAYNLALLLHDRKTDEATREAAELYQVAVGAEPERWDAWANLAAALQELKQQPVRIRIDRKIDICVDTYISVHLSPSLYIYIGISRSRSLSLYIYISTYIYIYLYLSIYLYLCIYLSIYPSIYLFIDLPTYLSIYISIYLSIYLSFYLSVCLSIYLSMFL